MTYTYIFHPLTKEDYNEAFEWYENKQKGLGERFLQAVRKKIEEIVLQPEAYGTKGNKKFREAEISIFPYLLVYKLNKRKKEIYISSIHHSKKHPRKKYRKE
ncbi:MAG: type II toxin-antitoxin system RelE/ParE family toxin [Ginsengibacter sp.]